MVEATLFVNGYPVNGYPSESLLSYNKEVFYLLQGLVLKLINMALIRNIVLY